MMSGGRAGTAASLGFMRFQWTLNPRDTTVPSSSTTVVAVEAQHRGFRLCLCRVVGTPSPRRQQCPRGCTTLARDVRSSATTSWATTTCISSSKRTPRARVTRVLSDGAAASTSDVNSDNSTTQEDSFACETEDRAFPCRISRGGENLKKKLLKS